MQINGADHDYKEDVKRAAEENYMPTVTAEATMEALDYLLGIDRMSSSVKVIQRQKQELDDAIYALGSGRVDALVNWVVHVLQGLLKQVTAQRNAVANQRSKDSFDDPLSDLCAFIDLQECENSLPRSPTQQKKRVHHVVVDELKEVIDLPEQKADRELLRGLLEEDPDEVELSPKVLKQLKSFVVAVSKLYRNNPFHNCKYVRVLVRASVV